MAPAFVVPRGPAQVSVERGVGRVETPRASASSRSYGLERAETGAIAPRPRSSPYAAGHAEASSPSAASPKNRPPTRRFSSAGMSRPTRSATTAIPPSGPRPIPHWATSCSSRRSRMTWPSPSMPSGGSTSTSGRRHPTLGCRTVPGRPSRIAIATLLQTRPRWSPGSLVGALSFCDQLITPIIRGVPFSVPAPQRSPLPSGDRYRPEPLRTSRRVVATQTRMAPDVSARTRRRGYEESVGARRSAVGVDLHGIDPGHLQGLTADIRAGRGLNQGCSIGSS